MAIRSATGNENEHPGVPSLEIVPRLEAVGDGYSASLRAAAGSGLRTGAAALVIAAAVAAVVFVVVHRTRHTVTGTGTPVVRAQPPLPRAERIPVQNGADQAVAATGARLAVPGLRKASAGARRDEHAATTTAATQSPVSYAHDLSSSDLTSLADGASVYRPAGYLIAAYQRVAARYRIPWRLLAAVEYIQGGYVHAIAGASAKPELTLAAGVGVGGQRATNAAVLAHAIAAAGQPSAALLATGRRLAADGVMAGPAHGLATYLQGTGTSPQAVLTLAQEIGSATAGSTTTPLAKVGMMLREARLLNGLPYVWGGGHTNPAWVVGSGYDCSGFVSEVLHSAGYLTSPETTQTLPGAAGIARGPGKYVTLYDRTIATEKVWVKKKKTVTVRKAVNPASVGVHVDAGRRANSLSTVSIRLPKWVGEWKTIKITKLVPSLDNNNNDEHVIIDIGGQWWESGGSSADGGGEMVHRIVDPSKSYLKSFNKILHPAGL